MGCSATKHEVVQNPKAPHILPTKHSPHKPESNNNTDDSSRPIETRHEERNTLNINSDGVIEDELLTPNKSNDNSSRPRSISIITDDGVGDVGEDESANQTLSDIEAIYTALHQFNVFEADLISTIVAKHCSYRQLLRIKYTEKYDEDLVKTVRHNTSGALRYMLTSLLYSTEEYLATLMKQYITEQRYVYITESLTAWNSVVINNMKQRYFEFYDSSFPDDVANSLTDKVPKTLKDIMIPISALNRVDNNREIEESDLIGEAADNLSQGANEILELLTQKPYSKATLASIFDQYKLRYYLDITDSIDIEFQDQAQLVLSTIVKTAENCTKYFTQEIRKAIKEKNEKRIIDILVGRHTVDLKMISTEYKEQYGASFTEAVLGSCTDDYKGLLKVFFKCQLK